MPTPRAAAERSGAEGVVARQRPPRSPRARRALPILWRARRLAREALSARRRRACCIVGRRARGRRRARRAALAERPTTSASSSSSRCATRRSSSSPSSGSTRRSSCSRRGRRATTTTRSSSVLDLLPDVPAGKLAIADLEVDEPRRDRRARARRSRRRDRRLAATSPTSSVRPHPRSERTRQPVGRPLGRARGAARAGAAALRLVGIQYGLPFRAPEPRRAEHRPARLGDGARRRARPALVRLPDARHVPARAVPGVAGRAVVPDRAARRRRARARRESRPPGGSGARAYGPVAGFVAAAAVAVETTYVAYSRMAVTDVPLTLGVTVALALMVSGRLELAGLAVGLAASAKYPGIFLLVPLVVAGWGRWRRLAIGVAARGRSPSLATSPFVARRTSGRPPDDAWRVQRWRAYGLARVRERPRRSDRVRRQALGRLRARAADRGRRPRRRARPARRAPTSSSARSSSSTSRPADARTRTSTATCSRSCPRSERSPAACARSRP